MKKIFRLVAFLFELFLICVSFQKYFHAVLRQFPESKENLISKKKSWLKTLSLKAGMLGRLS